MKKEEIIYLTDRIACAPDWSWNSIASGWKGYHIWCVEGGHTDIEIQDEKYTLSKDDIFLFDLNYNHICSHDPSYPLKVSTIYFNMPSLAYKRRAIRQNPFLAEVVRKVIMCRECGQTEEAYMWLKALMTEFAHADCPMKMQSEVIKKTCTLMEERLFEKISLGALAEEAGYSKNQFIRLFRKELGCTPMQYYMQKKISYAKSRLLYSNQTLKEISDMLGFSDESYFGKVFKEYVGCSPGSYRGKSL